MILAPFVSIGASVRFPFVSMSIEGRAAFVSRSFPSGFPSFPVSHPIHGKRETNVAECDDALFRCCRVRSPFLGESPSYSAIRQKTVILR